MSILVTGAGGLVGRALSRGLSVAGHEVTPLVRRRPGTAVPERSAWWDPEGGELDAGAWRGTRR